MPAVSSHSGTVESTLIVSTSLIQLTTEVGLLHPNNKHKKEKLCVKITVKV